MPYRLEDYTQFGGHIEMGTVRNALAYQGVTMPHSGDAPTQALLFGISGGVRVQGWRRQFNKEAWHGKEAGGRFTV